MLQRWRIPDHFGLPLRFCYDSDDLTDTDRPNIGLLRSQVSILLLAAGRSLHIHGYASRRGSRRSRYNRRLACHRAAAVKQMLRLRTIAPIVLYSHGKTSVFGSQDENQRVVVYVHPPQPRRPVPPPPVRTTPPQPQPEPPPGPGLIPSPPPGLLPLIAPAACTVIIAALTAAMESYKQRYVHEQHWRDVMDAWFCELGPNPATYSGLGDPRNRSIAHDAGFIELFLRWVNGARATLSDGSRIHAGGFRWRYELPVSNTPGGAAAYDSATHFLGTYDAGLTRVHGGVQVRIMNRSH